MFLAKCLWGDCFSRWKTTCPTLKIVFSLNTSKFNTQFLYNKLPTGQIYRMDDFVTISTNLWFVWTCPTTLVAVDAKQIISPRNQTVIVVSDITVEKIVWLNNKTRLVSSANLWLIPILILVQHNFDRNWLQKGIFHVTCHHKTNNQWFCYVFTCIFAIRINQISKRA